MFKQGAFVNVLTDEPSEWREVLTRLKHLPSLDHIELWLEYLPAGGRLLELREIFRGLPLIIHGPFIHLSLVSHLPSLVALSEQRFDETVDFAGKIGATVITFHAGSYPLFYAKSERLEKLAQRFERFTKITDPIVTLENMPVKPHGTIREPVAHLSDCEELMKMLPHLKLTLDVGHSIQNGDDYVRFIRKNVARIANIHLHDGVRAGRAHQRLGTGEVDLDSFLKVLRDVQYLGRVSLETLSFDDTQSSWDILRHAEFQSGILGSKLGSLHHDKFVAHGLYY